MKSILMICLGNICRSPLAEGILKHKLKENGIKAFVDSAGTAGYHIGELPDRRSIEVAKKHGIDLTDQRSRKFSIQDFDTFDHIVTMDKSNYEDVCSMASNPEQIKKVSMILNASSPGSDKDVPDPYYGGKEGFEHVFQLLDVACNAFIKTLK